MRVLSDFWLQKKGILFGAATYTLGDYTAVLFIPRDRKGRGEMVIETPRKATFHWLDDEGYAALTLATRGCMKVLPGGKDGQA